MDQARGIRRRGATLTRTFRPVFRFRIWLIPLLIAALLGLGWLVRSTLDGLIRDRVAGALHTLVDSNVTALDLWLDDQRAYVSVAASKSSVRGLAARLSALHRNSRQPAADLLAAPETAELRAVMQPIVEGGGYDGFVLTDDAGVFLVARDDLVGTRTRFFSERFVQRALTGETVVSHPLPDASDQPVGRRAGDPFMAAVAPVYDDAGQLVGLLGLSFSAREKFTRLLRTGRMAESGETYAFDRNGLMISESRFEDDLREIGLLPHDETVGSVLNVEIRDPGGNMKEGFRPEISRGALPLTAMAASAIDAGATGENPEIMVNVEGYRDYRGVMVVGAWTWLPEYEFGVTSELDLDEAMAVTGELRSIFWGAMGLLGLIGGIVVLSTLVISRVSSRANRALAQARQLGQYTLETRIGAGGMGEVYRASHAMLRRPTAIKLLPPGRGSKHDVARFEREVQITSRLTHPNTIEIYDYGRTSDGVFYYAMEFLPGIDLDGLIDGDGPQPAGRVIHILRQVCGSLEEAHNAGLIHRDIKPGNVILCERGGRHDVAKVLDFGIVKSVDGGDTSLTAAGNFTGTPLYMAPETIRNPDKVDHRIDIYALGVVGYFLLTGTELFAGSSLMELYSKHLQEQPEPPAKRLGRPVPADLEQVILSCLEKDRERRPASAADLEAALGRCADAGTWTQDDARAWWKSRGEAAPGETPATDPTVVSRTGPGNRTLVVDYVQRIGAD